MSRAMNFSTFVRNAKACENAKHPKCSCACGGKLHGQSHAGKLLELWDDYLARTLPPDPQLRLPEDAP